MCKCVVVGLVVLVVASLASPWQVGLIIYPIELQNITIKIYQKEQIEKTYIPDTRNLSFFLLLSVTNPFVVGTNSNKRY